MPATTITLPAAAQITALPDVREYPAISVLLSTAPTAQLGHADAVRLDALTTQAIDRVRADLAVAARDSVAAGPAPDGVQLRRTALSKTENWPA